MSPYEGREITAARSASAQGRLRIDRMEKVTKTNLEKYTEDVMHALMR